MVIFSRSTKPRPRHQPRVEALEDRLALSAGTPTAGLPFALHSPAAIGATNSGTATPAPVVPVPFNASTVFRISNVDFSTNPPTLTYVGTGNATLTGRFQETATVVPTLDPVTGEPVSYTAEATLTAANGDQIKFSATAIFTSFDPTTNTATARGMSTITSGTGRFEDAAGTIEFVDDFQFGLVEGFPVAISDHQTIEGQHILFAPG